MTEATASSPPRIVQAGDPVLRAGAALVSPDEIDSDAFRALVARMIATMRAAPGVGLAAPQIGVSKQVVVVEDSEELLSRSSEAARAERERVVLPLTVIVNPTVSFASPERVTFLEGCLSISGYVALVTRARSVVVTGLDATGPQVVARTWELRGWPARILQHEVDHLRGTLYVDRMKSRSLAGPDEAERWLGRTTAEIAAELGVDLSTE